MRLRHRKQLYLPLTGFAEKHRSPLHNGHMPRISSPTTFKYSSKTSSLSTTSNFTSLARSKRLGINTLRLSFSAICCPFKHQRQQHASPQMQLARLRLLRLALWLMKVSRSRAAYPAGNPPCCKQIRNSENCCYDDSRIDFKSHRLCDMPYS